MLRIYIDSLEKNYTVQSKKLMEFYAFAGKGKYEIASDPKIADIILICDVLFDNYGEKIRKSPLIKDFLNKCFILSNIDRPLPVFRGILTAGEKSKINFGRIRTCSYNGYSDHFKNRFINGHKYSVDEEFEKQYLFSFIGRDSDPVRYQIFNLKYKRSDILLENTHDTFDLYNPNSDYESRQMHYYHTMLKSKFVLCPRGWGTSSYRLFEAMSLGIVPVIISDEWILPRGPKWKDFSIIVSKNNIKNIEAVLTKREKDFDKMGRLARKAYNEFFADDVIFEYIIHNCLAIKRKQVIPESVFFYFITPLFIRFIKFKKGKYVSIRNGFNLLLSKPIEVFQKPNRQKLKRFFRE